MTPELEFQLRINPKSCPWCFGSGEEHTSRPSMTDRSHMEYETVFCICPLGREMFKKKYFPNLWTDFDSE